MTKHERSIGGDNGNGGPRRSGGGWLGLLACAWLSTASIGCDKPTAGECKKAILNIRAVLGTSEQSEFASQTGAWVRSCRGSAKRKAVTCAMESASVEALKGCGLISTKEIDELIELDRQLKQLDPARPGAGATGTAPGVTPPGTGTVPATGAGAATGTDPGPGSGAGHRGRLRVRGGREERRQRDNLVVGENPPAGVQQDRRTLLAFRQRGADLIAAGGTGYDGNHPHRLVASG